MSRERSVIVRGLPRSATTDVLELLFEDARRCPNGGSVENVYLIGGAESCTATVTFKEARVAERLLAAKTLHWHDSVLQFSPKPRTRHSLERQLSSSEMQRDKIAREDFNQRTEKLPTTLNDEESGTSSDDDDFYDALSNVVTKPTPSSTATETSPVKPDQTADIAASFQPAEDKVTYEISDLTQEKLELLSRMLRKKLIRKQCSVEVKLDCRSVVLTGTKDELLHAQLAIYAALANASSHSVDISREVAKLITSPKGQRWFDEHCDKSSFIGLLYVDSSGIKLLAADETMLGNMRHWFDRALLSKRKPIEHHHSAFLKSQSWLDFVKNLTDLQLILLTVDWPNMVIVIEGLMDAVKNTNKEIDNLLSRQCPVTKTLALKPADFRTLAVRNSHIANRVQEAVETQHGGAVVKTEFKVAANAIELSGRPAAVDAAVNYIRSTYISTICHDTLELSLPGLTVADFKNSDSIEFIEFKNKSGIDVSSKHCQMPAEDARDPSAAAASLASVTSTSSINVVKGNLVEFKADVLVNPIASGRPDLTKAGALSLEFSRIAGPELQQELAQKWPIEFGKDLTSTSTYGKFHSKKIYHVAVGGRRNTESEKMLQDLIVLCLSTAADDKMSSIAFPTIGCGQLKFDAATVAGCFKAAEMNTGTTLKISECLSTRNQHSKQHAAQITSSCFYQLGRLKQVRRYVDNDVMAQLVAAFIASRLDYCSAVLFSLSQSPLTPVQRVQNTAARLVPGLRPYDHTTAA